MARVKIAAATLRAIALFLPQYTCDKYHSPDGKVVDSVPNGGDAAGYTAFRERHYAWENLTWRQPSTWIPPALFLWPLPLLILGGRLASRWMRRVHWLAEAGLGAISIYAIWTLSDVGQRAVGAYLGIAANGLYAAAWLGEVCIFWGRAGQPDSVLDREGM